MELDIDHPKVWLICKNIPGNPEMNSIIMGVWRTEKGCRFAFQEYKKYKQDFEYSIASYPIMEDGQIW